MPLDLALLSNLTGSNYLCLELISMVPKAFEPLKFYCIWTRHLSFVFDHTDVKMILRISLLVSLYINMLSVYPVFYVL